jgi:hypothetical protein
MVRRFILRCTLLGVPAVIALAVYVALYAGYWPAPRITANFALNEKLALARQHRAEGVDVLALGSSMTLNNLSSEGVMAHFGPVRYLNLGAWGMGAEELSVTGPALVERLRPDTVIVVTNLMDFKRAVMLSASDSAHAVRYLDSARPLSAYWHHWDAPYFLRQMEFDRTRFTDPTNYEYFAMDTHGGVTLDVPPHLMHAVRFHEEPPKATELDEQRYADLHRFARWLHERNIRLMVLASPYRDGLNTADVDAVQAGHLERLRAMLLPLGHVVIDAHAHPWPDALFVDASHFGPKGAADFTALCLPPCRTGD